MQTIFAQNASQVGTHLLVFLALKTIKDLLTIEVWSVNEGQQRFDNHVDKLLNYIRYWQASGESIKTSLRTKTRLEQLTEDGHFTGGGVPYG